MWWYPCLCAYECVACALIWHTQGKQIQTEWQAKMWRESCLSPHVLWQSASGGSEPACPLLLHMTLLCIGRPGLRALTKPPWSSYICLTCQSGTQPCQRKFTAFMNNKLKPKRSYSSTTVSREWQTIEGPHSIRVNLHTWNQILLINACLSCYQKYFPTTGCITIKMCTNILDPKWITPNLDTSTFPLVPHEVDSCGSESNILTIVGWIVIKSATDTQGPLRITSNDFNNPPSFT